MEPFRHFVEDNIRWFRGHAPESDESLSAAERVLDLQIPDDIRWLLREYGYWHATGISSLDESIENTIAARTHLGLPKHFLVLYDHQDGGVILIDTIPDPATGENRVYNAGWEFVPDQLSQDIVYDSYLEYVRQVLVSRRDFINEENIDYDPKLYSDA